MSEYEIKSVTLTFRDSEDSPTGSAGIAVTIDPPMPPDYDVESCVQPCWIAAIDVLANILKSGAGRMANQPSEEEEPTAEEVFKGMRELK